MKKKAKTAEEVLNNIINSSGNYEAKVCIAEQGYGLDVLINDRNPYVRREVAHQRYGLDKLVNDYYSIVREEVARQGYGLEQLMHDPDWMVRWEVAKRGFGLDILINDENLTVSREAKQALCTHNYKNESAIAQVSDCAAICKICGKIFEIKE